MDSALQPSGAKSNAPWYMALPVIEDRSGVLVVRDDLLAGGSKVRFLPYIVGDASEVVFGGPFCGGEPCASPAPFPSCLNYDAKAWEQMAALSRARPGRALFWNVVGHETQDLEELR